MSKATIVPPPVYVNDSGTMMAIRALTAFLSLLLFTPAPDPREIVLASAGRDARDMELARNYTFFTRSVEHRLDGNGKVKSQEEETHEVLILYGRPYERLVEKNGAALPAGEQSKETAKMEKEMRRRAGESEKDRLRRQRADLETREDRKAMVREVADAFTFTMLGEEKVDGHDCWVVQAEPKPGYRPKSRRASILPKVRGKLWITKEQYRWVKMEAEVIDTFAIGWLLLRVQPGTRMRFEQARVQGEIWMPHHAWIRGVARLALVKKFNVELEIRWEKYRKFQTDSRILATEEKPPEPARKP